MVIALVRALRPRQWVKNLFVAAPLVFARRLEELEPLTREAAAVLAFCLLSGAVYLFNDVRDVEADRQHPTKKFRPIAAGQLSEKTALWASVILALAALGGCLLLSWKLAVFAGGYLTQNVAYTLRLKRIAFVDVVLIASGFILRVYGGAAAIDVPASGWLLLCTGLLAMLLGFGKRAHELAWAQRSGVQATRESLGGYRLPPLRVAMLILAIVTFGAYIAYTFDPHTIEMFQTTKLVYSAPFAAIGIGRFLTLALASKSDDSPTDVMLRDPMFLVALVGAAAMMVYAIYG